MVSVESVTGMLSFMTLIGILFVLFVLGLIIYNYYSKKKIRIKFFEENGLLFAFLVAVVSMLGSLYFSEIVGYEPCRFCWFQRIFVYSSVVVLFVGLYRKAKDVVYYVVPLTVIGVVIGAYHYYIQLFPSSGGCLQEAVACSTKFVFDYGLVTLPLMGVVSNLIVLSLMWFWWGKFKKDDFGF
ncbi:MAG: disulfide bond formation protein B [Nanoarchaeota archaeon]|nr:disulfide bond formation protein B [Nanoarchaeota archaeon]